MSTDDDSELSTSSRDYLESPYKAKREALKQKLQKEGFNAEADQQGADLKNLKLSVLKAQVVEAKSVQSKNDQKSVDVSSSFATLTREQEIEAAKLTAQTKPSTDQQVKQGRQQQKVEEELKREETQTEDA